MQDAGWCRGGRWVANGVLFLTYALAAVDIWWWWSWAGWESGMGQEAEQRFRRTLDALTDGMAILTSLELSRTIAAMCLQAFAIDRTRGTRAILLAARRKT